MDYLTIKSLHIIFIVTWFAGLFYSVRLFVYQRESLLKNEPQRSVLTDQLSLMAKRLWYGITWPSSILAIFSGSWLLILNEAFLTMDFMHVKLAFVFFLIIYQLICQRLFSKLQKDELVWTSLKLRIWNEVATIILVGIVFLIVNKNSLDWLYGTLGLVIFAVILMLVIKSYKRIRQ